MKSFFAGALWGLNVVLTCQFAVEAEEKPDVSVVGWRQNWTGQFLDAKPPLEWSDEKNVLWSTKTGRAIASPVISGQKVFVTVEPDILICLDRATGQKLWQKTNGTTDLPEELRGKDLSFPTECGYATPTPVADGKHVYALFGTGIVACYDFEGNRKWIVLLDAELKEFQGRSASPLLMGDRLIVHVSDLFCLDAASGKALWQVEASPAFGTPLITSVGDCEVVVTPKGDVFRLSDGSKLASEIAEIEVPSPVSHKGVLYFISSLSKAVRLVPDAGGKTIKAEKLWEAEVNGEVYASPAIHDGLIYAVTKRGEFVVLDAADGKTVSSRRLDMVSECSPSLSLVGKHLFLSDDSGLTLVYEPGREPKELQKNRLKEGSASTAAFVDDAVFVRSGAQVLCLKASSRPQP